MGFGLCSFGFLLLMLEPVGLNFLGYAVMSMGFFGVASELKDYKGYRVAAYASAAACPFALVDMYRLVAAYTSLPNPDILLPIKGIPLCLLSVVLCFAYCNPTARIAADGGARTFSLRANATAYLTALYMALKLAGSFGSFDGSLAAAVFIGNYVILFLNAWLLFTCFTTITTEKRYAVEQEIIKQETEELVRKRILKGKEKGWKRKDNSEVDAEDEVDYEA